MATSVSEPTVVTAPVTGRAGVPGEEYRLGVEEELMLLDPEGLGLADAIETVLHEAHGRGPLKAELMQCQVEISTEPCRSVSEAHEQLLALRTELIRDARQAGARVAAAGTHPFSRIEEQHVTSRDRYRELIAAVRYPALRIVVFGMHVHVSVGGATKALAVIEAMLPDLPLLLALSASSPFLAGEETGLASTRLILGQGMPRTGLPPAFESYEDYAASLERLRVAGAVGDATQIWWDVRLHPTFGTIEVRIMDAQPLLDDTVAIAGLVHALVHHYGQRWERGASFARANRFVIAENRWLAARHGLRAPLVDGGLAPVPARTLVARLLERVEDDAAAVGATGALAGVEAILRRGSSADRQMHAFRHGVDLAGVVRLLGEETETL